MSLTTIIADADTEVNVRRTTQVADGQGGYTTTTAIILRRLPCRFNALTSKDLMLAYDKQKVFANYVCFLEYESNVREGDELIKTDDSRVFEVKLKMDWDEKKNYLKLAVLELDRVTP